MAHGATRKIRRYALSYWMDLRGLDKRQQRRRVREDARRAAEFSAACELMLGLLFEPNLDLRHYLPTSLLKSPNFIGATY